MHRGRHGPVDPAPEGAEFRGVARSGRRGPLAIVLGGVAVLVVAVFARQAAPSVVDPTPRATPRAAAATPSPPRTVAPTSVVPPRDLAVTPRPTFVAVPAMAGATELLPAGSTAIRLAIDLPAGWARAGEAVVVKAGGTAPAGVSIGAWVLRDVYFFPCRWSTGVVDDPSLMATAAGQARALSGWWGQDPGAPPKSNAPIAPVASRPRPATIAGHDATYLEVLVLRGFDFAACDADQLVLWEAAHGDARIGLGPGELHRLWVVDVDDTVIVIDAASFPATSVADQAELQAIIDSAAFEP